jgi:membrane fusion protein (multidrug efflux system)
MQLQPGQQLMAVIPAEEIWITANFKETQVKRMKLNQRATIRVDAFDQEFEGYVESISPATGARFSILPPENTSGNYVKVVQRVPVRLRLKAGQDAEHRLRPGMSVVPKVYLQ